MAGRWRWGVGTLGWGDAWERGLQGISATSIRWERSAAVAAKEMLPLPISKHMMLHGAIPIDQIRQDPPKEPKVFGSDADAVDHQLGLLQCWGEEGMAGACGKAPRRVAASSGQEQRLGVRERLFGLGLWILIDSEIQIFWCGLAYQIQEALQSGAVDV